MVHIHRDLVKNFGNDSLIVKGFNEISVNYSACEEYINFLTQEMINLQKTDSMDGEFFEILLTSVNIGFQLI